MKKIPLQKLNLSRQSKFVDISQYIHKFASERSWNVMYEDAMSFILLPSSLTYLTHPPSQEKKFFIYPAHKARRLLPGSYLITDFFIFMFLVLHLL